MIRYLLEGFEVFCSMTSSDVDTEDKNKLVILVETGKKQYKRHLVNMTSWNMYVVEDLEGAKVNEYKYEVNYMPESIVPFTVTEKK